MSRNKLNLICEVRCVNVLYYFYFLNEIKKKQIVERNLNAKQIKKSKIKYNKNV